MLDLLEARSQISNAGDLAIFTSITLHHRFDTYYSNMLENSYSAEWTSRLDVRARCHKIMDFRVWEAGTPGLNIDKRRETV